MSVRAHPDLADRLDETLFRVQARYARSLKTPAARMGELASIAGNKRAGDFPSLRGYPARYRLPQSPAN